MKRLQRPAYGQLELYDQCIAEMIQPAASHFATNRAHIQNASGAFATASCAAAWCNLPRAAHGNGDALIAGTLTKSNLMALYSENVVKSKGRAREIYDEILVSAKGECPLCAGIGDPKTLDHYLPKARFPSLSVLPENLVPACRDCNMDKRSAFPFEEERQPIHPYLDADHFFAEKWASAIVERTDPITVRFFANPPAHWSDKDKARVHHHFIDCDLPRRFGLKVQGEISTLIDQRKSSLRILDPDHYRHFLLDVANCDALPINGWKRTLYSALAETVWFYEADFANPAGHLVAA